MSDIDQVHVQANNLVKQVSSPEGTLTILNGVSLSILAGEAVAVVGVSGSGKSTLLGILAGLDVPTSGTVRLNGVDITRLDEDGRAQVRADGVGFVFQSFQLLPSLTALENVMLPLELAGKPFPARAAGAELKRVGLSERLHHFPSQLSGGEQQRVAIARAYVARPKILFADEPTGNLDASTCHSIVDLLFSLNTEYGTTLVLVTHNVEFGERCQRHLELDSGVIKTSG